MLLSTCLNPAARLAPGDLVKVYYFSRPPELARVAAGPLAPLGRGRGLQDRADVWVLLEFPEYPGLLVEQLRSECELVEAA